MYARVVRAPFSRPSPAGGGYFLVHPKKSKALHPSPKTMFIDRPSQIRTFIPLQKLILTQIDFIVDKSSKKINFATSKIKTKNSFSHRPFISGYICSGPQVSTYRPKFCGKFESELRSGFRARNAELKGSGVSGSEGDNSLLRSGVLDQN